jgi:NACHT domain
MRGGTRSWGHGLRGFGWLLLGLAAVAVAVLVVAGALWARDAAQFNRWVGLATVAAVPIAASGVVLAIRDKITGRGPGGVPADGVIGDELASVVLAQIQAARSLLIGPGEAEDQAANLRFVKGTGRFREVGGAGHGDLDTILNYYQSLSPARLVILGDPGAGKTVLASELVVRLLEHRVHADAPVPVPISAGAYDTRQPWAGWLARHLALRFGLSVAVAARLIRDSRILPVVDGLDEMDPVGNPIRAGVLIAALNASMRGRSRAPVVLTCRHAGYQALARLLDRATHIEILPLTGQQAAAYLRQHLLTPGDRDRWQPVLAALQSHPSGSLAGQLATPWRLTLALTAYRDTGDPAVLLPPEPVLDGAAASEYAQRLDTLLLGHYIDAASRLHGADGRYTPGQVRRWLTALAQGLDWQARHHGSATDIQLHTWWQPAGKRIARIAHTALACVSGIVWVTAFATTGNPGLAVDSVWLFFAGACASASPSPRRLKFRQIPVRAGLSRLAAGLMTGFAAFLAIIFAFEFAPGFVVGFALRFAPGFVVELAAGLPAGCATGLMGGLMAGLAIGAADNSPQATEPREVIRADGSYGLVVGLVAGFGAGFAAALTVGVTVGVTVGLAYAVVIGLAVGLAVGFAFGAKSWTRYHVAIVITAATQRGPLRFAAFLDWANKAGLLRVSGTAYQFRHRQLQDWLTAPRRPPETTNSRYHERAPAPASSTGQ